ncbi:hypothetical protein UPYG_G00248120, partial [Umbra pygmaea]
NHFIRDCDPPFPTDPALTTSGTSSHRPVARGGDSVHVFVGACLWVRVCVCLCHCEKGLGRRYLVHSVCMCAQGLAGEELSVRQEGEELSVAKIYSNTSSVFFYIFRFEDFGEFTSCYWVQRSSSVHYQVFKVSVAMASWFSWSSEPEYRCPRRDPSDVVTDTLMLELSWQLKEAERMQRERDNEYRRLQTGVDYSWLANTPRNTYDLSIGERMGLEDLCSKVHPSYCGAVILRFRQAVMENEPEVQEVASLFRTIVLEALDRMKEEQEAQRLSRQWNNKRALSMSLINFK